MEKYIEIGMLYASDVPSLRLDARQKLEKLANLTPLDADCLLRKLYDDGAD